MTASGELDALWAARNLLGREVIRRAADALGAVGLRAVPLKGVLYAALAPQVAITRPMMDVDVLVAGSGRAAVDGLRRAGFEVVARADGTATLVHDDAPLHLDLHWRLFQRGLFRLPAAALIERGRLDRSLFGAEVVLPSGLDVYAHLVGHFVRGRHDRSDLRHVHDFALVARLYELDARETARHLGDCGMARASRWVLPLVADAGGDAFAREVLRHVPARRLDRAVAGVGGALIERYPGNHPAGALGCHLLNRSLGATTASFAHHVAHGLIARARRPARRG